MLSSTPNIYWLLVGPRDVASSRIHGYRIHEYLRRQGWTSELIVTPLHWLEDTPLAPDEIKKSRVFRNGDVVVLQKLCGPKTVSVLQALRDENVSTVFIDSDYPLKLSEAKLATVTVCPSESLAEGYRQEGIANVMVIPDTYEAISPPVIRERGGRKLRCVWFGEMDPIKAIEVRSLRKLLAEHLPDIELLVISNHSADVQWETEKSWDVIKKCDVAVITGSDYFWMRAKSANRVTQAMALGLPVVAYPLPSYQAVIHHGRNGMLCRSNEEWICALSTMRSADFRERIARTGYRYARRYFSLERVGEQWTEMFRRLGAGRSGPDSFILASLSRLRLRHLRVRACRGMAATFKPMLRLHRSYKVLQWKEWIF